MTNKTYLILQLDTEGDYPPTPLCTFPTKEQALNYIHERVAYWNHRNLTRYSKYEKESQHAFNPQYRNSFQIEELVEPTPIETPIIPVWYVKVILEGGNIKASKDEGLILKYYKPDDHLTYFPANVGDIPISNGSHWRYKWAHVFSKVSLKDAFSQAEEHLKSLGKSVTYRDSLNV